MGEQQNQPFQLSFNPSLKVDFQGSRVTSDGGLLLVRELDERLGLSELIAEHLTDSRGKNTQLPMADLLRQAVYSRLAGYEDVNDAERLSQDPTFRLMGSERIWERGAALTSRLQSFETELLTQEENLSGLAAINRELIARAEAIDSPQRVVLDMDSTEIPVYGQQEQSAYNGHFESTCYHPLLLFNGEGDCLAAKLRPGNVHSAEDWAELLLPEIERQQRTGQGSGVSRRCGLCQAGDLRGAGGAGREVCHSHTRQRQPGARHRGVADAARGKTEPQAGGLVQGLSLPGGELEDGAAGGGEGGVPLRGVVPASRVHRDQPGDTQPGGGAVLQQAGHGGAVDQGGQAGGEDDAALLSPFPLEPSAAGAEPAGLQPGEFVAAAGVAQANRELVADEFAAAAGEDRRTAGETCSLLLAAAGGETSDAAAVRGDAGTDRAATDTDGIGGS